MTREQLQHQLDACRELNPRRYQPHDTSPQEQAVVRNSLFELEPGIIYWYETTYQSQYSVDLLHQRLQELTHGCGRYCYVVDLTRARKPDAATRVVLKRMFSAPHLCFSAIFTEANVLLNIAARFVLRSAVAEGGFDVVKTYDAALLRARHELQDKAA